MKEEKKLISYSQITDKQHIKLKEGDLLIFPSSFIYPHEVKPIKKGVRYSYVSWVY